MGDLGKSILENTGKSNFEDSEKSTSENKTLPITDDLRQVVICDPHTSPDFSLLDHVSWIKILSYLDQKDRLTVAKTCTTLQEYCLSEGCLWRSLTMHVGWCRGSKENRPSEISLNETEKQVLQVSRGKIQDVDFILYNCDGQNCEEESVQCLNEASKTWPLKFLRFRVRHSCQACRHDTGICSNHHMTPLSKQLLIRCLTSKNVSQLKELTLDTYWLLRSHGSLAVFEALKDSSFSHTLETLVLEWNCFFELITSLTNDYMSALCSAVGRFKNLQVLRILSVFVTDQLLETLSQPGRASLTCFTLHCGTFPERLSSWPQLLASFPSLKIRIHCNTMCNLDNLIPSLPAYVPIAKWYVWKTDSNSRFDFERQKQLFQLLPLYAQHLTHLNLFEPDGTLTYNEEDFFLLIAKCTNLEVLRFYGQISCDVILKVAARKLKKLSVRGKRIIFPQTWEGDEEQKMARLCSEMSEKLGYPWRPSYSSMSVISSSCVSESRSSSCVSESRGILMKVKPKVDHL